MNKFAIVKITKSNIDPMTKWVGGEIFTKLSEDEIRCGSGLCDYIDKNGLFETMKTQKEHTLNKLNYHKKIIKVLKE